MSDADRIRELEEMVSAIEGERNGFLCRAQKAEALLERLVAVRDAMDASEDDRADIVFGEDRWGLAEEAKGLLESRFGEGA